MKSITLGEFSAELEARLENVSEEKVTKVIKLTCQKIRSDCITSMNNTPRDASKSYFANNKSIAHHPSFPGNPPAPDTGTLKNSIHYNIGDCEGNIGTNLDYGLYLETGTERMAPRPWLFPAVKGNVEFLKENFIKLMNGQKPDESGGDSE